MAQTSQVFVPDASSLESAVTSYIAQGFTVQNRTSDSVVLFKKKEFNVLWAVLGFFICLLPLLVYVIVYASQSDQMVEIRVGGATTAALASGPQWSDDQQYWWDGTAWQSAAEQLPAGMQRSDDGAHYWNGERWIAIIGTQDAGPETPTPPAD